MNNIINAQNNGNKNFLIESDFIKTKFAGNYGEMINKILELKKDVMKSGWSTTEILNDSFKIIRRSGHNAGIVGYVKITTA
jgi:hypothetical protein